MKSLSKGEPAPTLEEVARMAGVSRATASRVFTGKARVSDATRRAVERAARQLRYVPNQAARSLVTGRTDTVALVIPEPVPWLFGDPFYPVLIRGINETLSAHEVQLVLLAPQSPAEQERVERYLGRRPVDGALLTALHEHDPLPVRLRDRGLPVVLGGRIDDDPRLSYVDIDNLGGARRATEHLIQVGRRRIATITGPLNRVSALDRRAGYRQAQADAGLPPLEEEGDYTPEAGEQAMRRLLERQPDLDAVFCASDPTAVGALRALAAAGRRVPQDVAVVGFDDAALAATTEPPLTTVHQPIHEMGREMARLLLEIIAEPTRVGRRVTLATQLVIRGSSGGGR
ncbi:MAG TPA: LacI family DNA-binding transcriptional regulator [Candidatus Dormibacteraeota bacterium]|nr:LacI family DNA-binding transcriptional regulator [Candidatus Dormibacteraeota bacterium]